MNFVLELTEQQIEALMETYQNNALPVKETFILGRFKIQGVNITVYRSGKVMFQGEHAEEAYLFWQDTFKLGPSNTNRKKSLPFYFPSIGSDESGSGDYFGPLVAAAVLITEKDHEFLAQLTIQDSKTLNDQVIKEIAPKLIARLKYSLNILPNEKYNALIEEGYNLNKLKAYLHAQCHKTLLQKIPKSYPIVIDQFCTKTHYKKYLSEFDDAVIPDYFYTKAESQFASVAVASIIARYVFLKQLENLGVALNVTLEKGASNRVDNQAKRLVSAYGNDVLNTIAKKHFKNTKKVINQS